MLFLYFVFPRRVFLFKKKEQISIKLNLIILLRSRKQRWPRKYFIRLCTKSNRIEIYYAVSGISPESIPTIRTCGPLNRKACDRFTNEELMQSYSDDRMSNASGVIVSGRTSGGRSNRRLQLPGENRYRSTRVVSTQ